MNRTKKLWLILGLSIFVAFFILGWFGRELYRKIPPIPERVQSLSGEILMTKDDILRGQQVWQSIGGQQVGSIWGHGAYQAPDWSADWLHRESVALRNLLSNKQYGKHFKDLASPQQAAVQELLKSEMRANTYDKDTRTVTVSDDRAAAIAKTGEHYDALFSDDPEMAELRESYAIHESAIPQQLRRKAIANFFFWTSWAAATQRPDMDVSYTNNWPHEPLVDNHPTAANLMWSLISIVCLIAGVGALVWYKNFRDKDEALPEPLNSDPLDKIETTPSMKAAEKYALTVIALFILQVLLGACLDDCSQPPSDRSDADHGEYNAWVVVCPKC